MTIWNIYEIVTESTSIHGIMLRGRIRKFALENQIELLTENATDKNNCVRFALVNNDKLNLVNDFIKDIVPDAIIILILESISNPVLSKLKVNKEERYSI